MKVVVNWSLEVKVFELAPNDSLIAPNSYLLLLCLKYHSTWREI